MRPLAVFSAAFATTAFLASSAFATDTSSLQTSQLYSAKTGKASRFACFSRHYDDAHLASHPHQNVRAMLLFAQKSEDADDPSTRLEIDVYFRGVKKHFDIDGSCTPDKDHPGTLACGIDCDGGRFGLRQNAANEILVDIPPGVQASTEGTEGPERSSEANPKAKFGSDDQTFKLDRADLKECAPLDQGNEMKK